MLGRRHIGRSDGGRCLLLHFPVAVIAVTTVIAVRPAVAAIVAVPRVTVTTVPVGDLWRHRYAPILLLCLNRWLRVYLRHRLAMGLRLNPRLGRALVRPLVSPKIGGIAVPAEALDVLWAVRVAGYIHAVWRQWGPI